MNDLEKLFIISSSGLRPFDSAQDMLCWEIFRASVVALPH